jgi:integrase
MKVADTITYCINYHKINSRPNTLANYEYLLGKFGHCYQNRNINAITTEEIITFLTTITEGRRQNTKRTRYTTLSAYFNLIINTLQPEMRNPCLSPAVKSLFQKPKTTHWTIYDKDTIDETIFRTLNIRNRILLELMARGGMRISEALGLKPKDIDGQKLLLHTPKSGREQEIVFIPKKLSNRLHNYVRDTPIAFDQFLFPITYAGARKIVVKVGEMVGIKLRPHDLRRHAATYASRSGVPIEIVSKIILRHADLSTTQRYLGKVSDHEAIRWIESLHG